MCALGHTLDLNMCWADPHGVGNRFLRLWC